MRKHSIFRKIFIGSIFSTSTLDWVDEFPLHRAACEGTVVGVLARINEGFDANQPDSDSWTPLHYASW